MTYAQVKQAWFDDSMDLVMATVEQIEKLCDELDNGDPLSRWMDYKEELEYLYAELMG